jgi:flagellar hook-length control protein FliK
MATPIKSSNINGTTANGAAISPALNDLMSRLNAQANGSDTQNQQAAFSRWLEKHAIVADGQSAAPKSPSATAAQPSSTMNEASRAAEQALARARHQAAVANKPVETAADKPVTHADTAPADKVVKAKTETQQAKPARKDAATKSSSADKTAKAEGNDDDKAKGKDQDDEVAFNTSMGDGSAVVRELTPPPSIQPGDSAGMMAWLASLTNADLAQGKSQTALQQDAAATPQGVAAEQTADPKATDVLQAGKHAGGADQAGLQLDPALWQPASGGAQQTEALLAKLGKVAQGRGDGDALAGLMSGGALKGASFGEIMNNATQNVRHESATLNAPFGSADFAQALAEKVSMWVSSAKDDGAMTAELHLNPAEMGPINVKISLDGQSAHVDFAAAALETRQAIEASMPMLSSALSDVGLSLTGGDVSSQTSQQQAFSQAAAQAQAGRMAGGAKQAGDSDADGLVMRPVSAPRAGRAGGLDLYA